MSKQYTVLLGTLLWAVAAGLSAGCGKKCDADADCEAGETCFEGVCKPLDTGNCETALVCEGDHVVTLNLCTLQTTPDTTCMDTCYQGACTTCAPDSGRICDGNTVRSVDSCGTLGATLETCAADCSNGQCQASACTDTATTVCVGNKVYAETSCGGIGSFVQDCFPSGCVGGACAGCNPMAFVTCYDGDKYYIDSCEYLGSRAEDCADTCQNGSCTTATCTPNAFVTCFDGNIHQMDSCLGVQQEIAEACPNGCDSGSNMCNACEKIPRGTMCDGDNLHYLEGGCAGQGTEQGLAIEACANGCHQGACLAPGQCIDNWGISCAGDDRVYIDSCGGIGAAIETCPHGCSGGFCGSDPNPPMRRCECNAESCFIMEGTTVADNCDPCLIPSIISGSCPSALMTECETRCTTAFSCSPTDFFLTYGMMTLGQCDPSACGICTSPPCTGCFDLDLCEAHCSDP